MSRYYKFLVYPILLVLVVGYFNCTGASPTFTSDLATVVSNIRSEENTTGGAYLGKPIEGEYVRTFPGYSCANQPSEQGFLNVTTNAHIFKDSCQDTNINFAFTDAVLDFSAHNRDFLGVGTAIYELSATRTSNLLPITEVWCKFKGSNTSFDIVAKVNSSLSEAQAKIYLSLNGANRATTPFQVMRSQSGNTLTFTSQSISLRVQKSGASDQFSSGHATMMVDNITFDQDVSCRIADIAPAQEMGIGLSNFYALNSLITDSQEAMCAHAGVLSCDNMEDRVSGADLNRAKFANQGWGMTPGSYTISPMAFDGSRSLEMPIATNGAGSGNLGFSFSATPELYVRFYVKWSANFLFSPNATGLMTLRPTSSTQILFTFDSSRFLAFNDGLYFRSNFQPNVNQWYCMEAHLKSSSTNGANDGVIELWANDAKVIDARNRNINGVLQDWGYFGTWYCGDTNSDGVCDSETHPAQSVFLDNIVAASQRIGCF